MKPLFIRMLLMCGLAMLMIASSSCRRTPAEEVVLYVSVDEHFARLVIDAFQKQTGVSVKVVGDSEAKKTSGLVDRLRSEKDKPQADVFWSSEIVLTVVLANDGVLDEHLSDATREWPREWRDGQRRWFAFASRPRVIVIAPDRLPQSERPTTWLELTQGRWKDKIVMADPRFGTTGTHLAVMQWYWDREVSPGYFSAWAQGLAANNVRLLPSGNAGVVDAVAKGEAEIGMTDADDVWAAQARGLKVDLIYPQHAPAGIESSKDEPLGTLLIPNTVARVKGGPNASAAAKLIDFLLSEQVERMLAESDSHNVPMRSNLQAEFAKYAVPDPLKVDWEKAAASREKAIESFFNAAEIIKRERAEAGEFRREDVENAETSPNTQPMDGDDGGG